MWVRERGFDEFKTDLKFPILRNTASKIKIRHELKSDYDQIKNIGQINFSIQTLRIIAKHARLQFSRTPFGPPSNNFLEFTEIKKQFLKKYVNFIKTRSQCVPQNEFFKCIFICLTNLVNISKQSDAYDYYFF